MQTFAGFHGPCAGKLACTVLRGGSNGNVALLPDSDILLSTATSQKNPQLKFSVVCFKLPLWTENERIVVIPKTEVVTLYVELM